MRRASVRASGKQQAGRGVIGAPLGLPVERAAVLGFAVLMGVDRDDELRGDGEPEAGPPSDHVQSAWRSWLSALAPAAEAAMAAALAYESLPPDARDASFSMRIARG